MRLLSRRNSVVVLALTGALATVGIGYASIPGPDGTIKGCYATTDAGKKTDPPHSKGDIRIVDSGEACRGYEKSITWNQQGQKGVPGDPGVPGVPGAKGDACLPSNPACVGPKGDQGIPGAKGDACLPSNPACVGPKGDQGIPGTKGDACLASDPACVGPKGDKGDACLSSNPACVGPKGDKGDACLSSNPACVGPKGDKGDTGDACLPSNPACVGPKGDPGATHVIMRSADRDLEPYTLGGQSAYCDPGEVATGGGVSWLGGDSSGFASDRVLQSAPLTGGGDTPTYWVAAMYNGGTATRTMRVFVICASP